jgi:hypothetical protein
MITADTSTSIAFLNRSEAQQLRQLMKSLVTGDRKDVALQNEMWVEPVDRSMKYRDVRDVPNEVTVRSHEDREPSPGRSI